MSLTWLRDLHANSSTAAPVGMQSLNVGNVHLPFVAMPNAATAPNMQYLTSQWQAAIQAQAQQLQQQTLVNDWPGKSVLSSTSIPASTPLNNNNNRLGLHINTTISNATSIPMQANNGSNTPPFTRTSSRNMAMAQNPTERSPESPQKIIFGAKSNGHKLPMSPLLSNLSGIYVEPEDIPQFQSQSESQSQSQQPQQAHQSEGPVSKRAATNATRTRLNSTGSAQSTPKSGTSELPSSPGKKFIDTSKIPRDANGRPLIADKNSEEAKQALLEYRRKKGRDRQREYRRRKMLAMMDPSTGETPAMRERREKKEERRLKNREYMAAKRAAAKQALEDAARILVKARVGVNTEAFLAELAERAAADTEAGLVVDIDEEPDMAGDDYGRRDSTSSSRDGEGEAGDDADEAASESEDETEEGSGASSSRNQTLNQGSPTRSVSSRRGGGINAVPTRA